MDAMEKQVGEIKTARASCYNTVDEIQKELRKASVLAHHALPGHVRRTDVKRPANLTGHAGIACQKGDLSVAYDMTGRHGAHDVVDLFKEVHDHAG